MPRIMIIGQPGSGKSTLARRLGEATGIPIIHIDRIHWQPNWQERSQDEKTRLCLAAEAQEHWIFEGGHAATWANRVARADLLIWLDRAPALRFWRALKRTLKGRGHTRPDLPDHCPERLRNLPGFFRFMWTTRHSARNKMQQLVSTAPDHCRVVHLRSDRDVEAFLAASDGAAPGALRSSVQTLAK